MTLPYNSLYIIILFILPQSMCFAQATKIETNNSFLESSIVEICLPLFDTLSEISVDELLFSCNSRADENETALFLQDVLVNKLVNTGLIVYLQTAENPEQNVSEHAAFRLNVILEDWILTARKSREEEPDKHIILEFGLQLRYYLLNRNGKILSTRKLSGTRSGFFENKKMFSLSQEKQPQYARAQSQFTSQNNNLLSTILIAGVTGITIFLIYFLRSQ